MSAVVRPDQWVEKRFPNPAARRAADEAIEALPLEANMTTYIDTWIAAYKKRAGLP